MAKKLVRFDWAMKKMLRHKANFDILEGFLLELLGEDVKIKQVLDGESNKETEDDKFNRVDILVENEKGELVIIEVQNTQEYDYFHRMLYGASKAITEHIKAGSAYAQVKKVISITIAYFDLGQGKDYVYHGTTVGLKEANEKLDTMKLPEKERKAYDQYLRHLMSIASRNHTIEIDAKEIIKKAKEEEKISTIAKLHKKGKSAEEISDLLDIPIEEVVEVLGNQSDK